MTKRGFTLDEHRDVGARLGSIRNELVSLCVKIGNAYPQRLSDDLDNAIKSIDNERSNLEDLACKENHELDNAVLVNIYYGDLSRKHQEEKLCEENL